MANQVIEKDLIIVKPLAYLKPIGIALLLLFILSPIATLLILVQGNLSEIQPSSLHSMVLVLPMMLACIPLFTYSSRRVIFDQKQQAIYLKTIFGKKLLLQFNEVDDIVLKATLGMAYYVKSKADRYGKGYRISSSFANDTDKAKIAYDSTVLPAIRQMLAATQAIESNTLAQPEPRIVDAAHLEFYKPHNKVYILKIGNRFTYLPALVMFTVAAWYLRKEDFGIMFFIPITIIVALISKRVVFDTVQKQVSVYFLGIRFKKCAFIDFSGFNIVRKTYNGMYNGTDVTIKFLKPGSKTLQEVTLRSFGKTNPIEPFMNETEFIVKKG